MNSNRKDTLQKLERISDSLSYDVDKLPDNDLFQEASETYGNLDKAIAEVRGIIEGAISEYSKHRLMAARDAYKAHTRRVKPLAIKISQDRKRALIDEFSSNDSQLRERLTMAARNENSQEIDIDSFLEDLLELGVIDEEGNIR
ncbi:MAG: hypothetical protein P8173_13295 [Gammaproteobacteria bacterium]|jgi:hypothetical protein